MTFGSPPPIAGSPAVLAPTQPVTQPQLQMQTPNEAPAVAVSPSMDQRVAQVFAEQQQAQQQAQQQWAAQQQGPSGAGGAGNLGVQAPPAQFQQQPQPQQPQVTVQPEQVQQQQPQQFQQPQQVQGQQATPPPQPINPFVAPAPTDTADLFGRQITRQDAQLIAQTQDFLRQLTPAQVQAFERTLQNPTTLNQPPVQPQPQQQYVQPPPQQQYVQQPPQYAPQSGYPVNPNIPTGPAVAPGQSFFGPPGTTGATGQQLAQQPDPFADPFAQRPVPAQPYVPQVQYPMPQQPDPALIQMQQQLAQVQQQQAAFQAQTALQQQAAAYKPYGDAAIAQIQNQYQLQPHEMQHVITRAQQSSDLLNNAFAQSPQDPTAAYVSVMDAIVWGDPILRQRAATTLGSQQAQSIAQINQQRARAGSLSASGGTIPRVDAVPVDASGRPNYRQGMVGALSAIMSGQNGQTPAYSN